MNPEYRVINHQGIDLTPSMFVRGQDQVAEDSEQATGIRISLEDFEEIMKPKAFIEMVWEMFDRGSCIIPNTNKDMQEAYLASGLTIEELSEKSGVSVELIVEMVVKSEHRSKRVSIHEMKKVCDVLGLDVKFVGFLKEWLKESNSETL